VSSLIAEGTLRESVYFSAAPADCLTYSVQLSASASVPSASHNHGGLVLTLPRELAEQWANSEQTGITHSQSLGDGSDLRIVVEKDFRCLQPRPEEDEADNFPHPDPESCGSSS